MRGKVVFFNAAKGWGFIRFEDHDYFAHWTEIQMDGYKELKSDQDVEFEVSIGPKGKEQAMGITVIA